MHRGVSISQKRVALACMTFGPRTRAQHEHHVIIGTDSVLLWSSPRVAGVGAARGYDLNPQPDVAGAETSVPTLRPSLLCSQRAQPDFGGVLVNVESDRRDRWALTSKMARF